MQSKIKGVVQGYGKLMLAWQNDVNDLHTLLVSIQQLESNIAAVEHSLGAGQRNEEQATNYRMTALATAFPDLQNKLVHQMMNDREALFRQLRVCRCPHCATLKFPDVY
jgi:hypothetical protein